MASAPQKKEASDSTPQPPPSPFERAKATIKEPFDAAKWLTRFKSLTVLSLLISFGFLLFSAVVFVVGHKYIIQYWPHMQTSYVMLGLAEDPLKDNLVLHNIVSERRYSDGAMQLFVTGEIHSNAEKRQVIPSLSVEALGPDGRIIESWRIAPPKATIDPNTTVPFTSSTIAPEGTVVEVNLSFTEAPHDER